MGKFFKMEGIFYVFNEWRIIIDEQVFQKIKDEELGNMIYLLDLDKRVIAKAVLIRPIKPLPNGKTSLSLDIKDSVSDEEIRKSTFFFFFYNLE